MLLVYPAIGSSANHNRAVFSPLATLLNTLYATRATRRLFLYRLSMIGATSYQEGSSVDNKCVDLHMDTGESGLKNYCGVSS
jgi:hypothetical protein